NDRLPGDGAICEGLGQMFSQVGIDAKVNAISKSVYFPAQARREFSLFMNGWGTVTGEASYTLETVVHSEGPFNRISYKNAELDQLIEEGAKELDAEKRRSMLEKAMEITVAERAYIPVVVLQTVWASAKDKAVVIPRVNEETQAF